MLVLWCHRNAWHLGGSLAYASLVALCTIGPSSNPAVDSSLPCRLRICWRPGLVHGLGTRYPAPGRLGRLWHCDSAKCSRRGHDMWRSIALATSGVSAYGGQSRHVSRDNFLVDFI